METLRKRVTGIEGEEVTHSHYTVEAQVLSAKLGQTF